MNCMSLFLTITVAFILPFITKPKFYLLETDDCSFINSTVTPKEKLASQISKTRRAAIDTNGNPKLYLVETASDSDENSNRTNAEKNDTITVENKRRSGKVPKDANPKLYLIETADDSDKNSTRINAEKNGIETVNPSEISIETDNLLEMLTMKKKRRSAKVPEGKAAKKGDQITFNKYHDIMAHYKYLGYLVKKYPFVDVKKIGMTYELRPIIVLLVCKGGCNNDKKAIWIDAGVHPREWITTASLSYLIKELVENDEKHPHLTEKFNWHILLIANPDGYAWTFNPKGDRNWRKNRNPENEAKCPPNEYDGGEGFGTDLNRNWGFSFKKQPDFKKCKSVYAGNEAFSELETRAVRDYLLPMKNKVLISNTIHAAGEYILIPYGHTRRPHPREKEMKEFVKVGRDAMTPYVGASYKIGSVPEVFNLVANGGSINWYAGVINVTYPMGMELTNKKKYGHNPPPSIIPDIGKGIFEFHKALVENSDNNKKDF